MITLPLSPLDQPYGPQTKTVQDNLPGGKVQNVVIILKAVFYDSLRFQLSYLTMLPPEKRRLVGV